MMSSCNTKMAAKEHLQCLYLRNQRSDRRHFNAYWTTSITTCHLNDDIRKRIDDVIVQYQDSRQRTLQETSVRSQRPRLIYTTSSIAPPLSSARSATISSTNPTMSLLSLSAPGGSKAVGGSLQSSSPPTSSLISTSCCRAAIRDVNIDVSCQFLRRHPSS